MNKELFEKTTFLYTKYRGLAIGVCIGTEEEMSYFEKVALEKKKKEEEEDKKLPVKSEEEQAEEYLARPEVDYLINNVKDILKGWIHTMKGCMTSKENDNFTVLKR